MIKLRSFLRASFLLIFLYIFELFEHKLQFSDVSQYLFHLMAWISVFYFEIHLSLIFFLSIIDLFQQAYFLDWVDHFFSWWTFELWTFLEHHRSKNHQRFLWEVKMRRKFASFVHRLKEKFLCSLWRNILVCSHLIGFKCLKTDY
jgi:hypothetical protein